MLGNIIESNKRFTEIAALEKQSTLFIGRLINKIVFFMKPDECYLNIGTWNGFTLFSGMLDNDGKECIGFDNFSEFIRYDIRNNFFGRFASWRSPLHKFYEMDYEKYFKTVHAGKIGFYFYDAAHSYDDQLKNLQLAEPFFSDDCIIMIDDTNWENVREATLHFIAESKNKYDILLDEKTKDSDDPNWWNVIMIFKRREVKKNGEID